MIDLFALELFRAAITEVRILTNNSFALLSTLNNHIVFKFRTNELHEVLKIEEVHDVLNESEVIPKFTLDQQEVSEIHDDEPDTTQLEDDSEDISLSKDNNDIVDEP